MKIGEDFSTVKELIRKEIGKTLKSNTPIYPYANALISVDSLNDNYGADSATSIAYYFLSNGSSWKGDNAKECKRILKKLLK